MTEQGKTGFVGVFSLALLIVAGCDRSDPPQAETTTHAADAAGIAADTLVAYEDFDNLEVEGFAPYYRDTGWEAVAVDSPKWPDMFGAAETQWQGAPGLYDLTLVTITEQDGQSSYRVAVGGEDLGEFQNPPGPDRGLAEHTWEGVQLDSGDVIRVASNSHSNLTVPEGDGFATSRGRWRHLILSPHVGSGGTPP